MNQLQFPLKHLVLASISYGWRGVSPTAILFLMTSKINKLPLHFFHSAQMIIIKKRKQPNQRLVWWQQSFTVHHYITKERVNMDSCDPGVNATAASLHLWYPEPSLCHRLSSEPQKMSHSVFAAMLTKSYSFISLWIVRKLFVSPA